MDVTPPSTPQKLLPPGAPKKRRPRSAYFLGTPRRLNYDEENKGCSITSALRFVENYDEEMEPYTAPLSVMIVFVILILSWGQLI